MGMVGSAAVGTIAAGSGSLYADADLVEVVVVAVGLGSDVVVGVGLDQGLKEVLVGYGASCLAEVHLFLITAPTLTMNTSGQGPLLEDGGTIAGVMEMRQEEEFEGVYLTKQAVRT